MRENVGFGAVILGSNASEFYDIWLTIDTRVAILGSFEEHPKVRAHMPDAYCGSVTPALEVEDHVDMGQGWRVNMYLHNEVADRHGAITWGCSSRTAKTLQGIEAPLMWAWDAQKRLVCIAAPIAPSAAEQASRP